MSVQCNCNECRSSHVYATNEFFVCRECGLVMEDMPVISDAPSFYTTKAPTPQVSHSPNAKIGTMIGNPQELTNKFKKLHRLQRQLTHIPATTAFHIFSIMKAQFNVVIPTEHYVDVFKHVYPIMPKKTTGRNIRKLCSIIFYRLSYNRHINIALSPILEYSEFSKSEYARILTNILTHLPRTSPYRRIFQRQSKEEYFQELAYALRQFFSIKRLPDHVVTLSKKLLYHYGQELGSKILIKASTAITLTLQYYNISNIKTYKVAEILGCSPSTVYKRAQIAWKLINFDRLIHPPAISSSRQTILTRNVMTLHATPSIYQTDPITYPRISSIFTKKDGNYSRRTHNHKLHQPLINHFNEKINHSRSLFSFIHQEIIAGKLKNQHRSNGSFLTERSGEYNFSPPIS